MRSRASRRRLSNNDIGCSASDRRWFPARPAQHVHRRGNKPARRDRSNIAVAHFLDRPRRMTRPYRVQCRVARFDMHLPAHTSHPLSRLFACFAGPIPSWTLRARHASLAGSRHADTASSVVALPSRHSRLLPFRQLCRCRACLGCLLHLFQAPGPDIIDVTIDRNPLRNERVLADAPDVVSHARSRILER